MGDRPDYASYRAYFDGVSSPENRGARSMIVNWLKVMRGWWYMVAWVSGRRCQMAVEGGARPCGKVGAYGLVLGSGRTRELIPLCARHEHEAWRARGDLTFHTGREPFTLTL